MPITNVLVFRPELCIGYYNIIPGMGIFNSSYIEKTDYTSSIQVYNGITTQIVKGNKM